MTTSKSPPLGPKKPPRRLYLVPSAPPSPKEHGRRTLYSYAVLTRKERGEE